MTILNKQKRQRRLPFCKLSTGIKLCSWSAVFLAELFNTTCCVHNFLCAGVERVTFRANFNTQSFLRHNRFGFEAITAAASHGKFLIIWMDVCFHFHSLRVVWCGECTHRGIA